MSKKFKIKSEKAKRKWQIFSYGSELSPNMVTGPHIEMFGNREIIIDGCNGVFEYSDTYLKLNIGHGTVILCGCDFEIVTFEDSTIRIRGNISSTEFCVS